MMEPLIADPGGPNTASKILGQSAGENPVKVPQVNGTDAPSVGIGANTAGPTADRAVR